MQGAPGWAPSGVWANGLGEVGLSVGHAASPLGLLPCQPRLDSGHEHGQAGGALTSRGIGSAGTAPAGPARPPLRDGMCTCSLLEPQRQEGRLRGPPLTAALDPNRFWHPRGETLSKESPQMQNPKELVTAWWDFACELGQTPFRVQSQPCHHLIVTLAVP